MLFRSEEKLKNIDKDIKDSSFSLQNWQSNYNSFLADKLELQNKIELEKSKIEAFVDNINNLEKRLKKFNESDSDNDNNIQIELLEQSESYQNVLMKFKVDFDRSLNNLPKDTIKPLNLKINELID